MDEPITADRFVDDEAAPRTAALADHEPGGAAELLCHAMGHLRQVVQVEAQVIGPGAGLGAPVLDHLEVLGQAGRTGVGDLDDRFGSDRVEGSMLTRAGHDRPPAAGGACLRQGDLDDARVELTRLRLRADDVERVILEDPETDTVTRRVGAVLAATVIVHRIRRLGEPIAVERAVDDGGHPPAGDGVLAQLEQTGGHRSGPRQFADERRIEDAGERPGEGGGRCSHGPARHR